MKTPEERAAEIVGKFPTSLDEDWQVATAINLIVAALRDAGPKVVSDESTAEKEWLLTPHGKYAWASFEAGFQASTRLNSIAAIEKLWPSNQEAREWAESLYESRQWGPALKEICDWLKAELLRRLEGGK